MRRLGRWCPRAILLCAAALVPTLSESAESEKLTKGPLKGLPSKPGAHVKKIKSLADNSWLELGKPAKDPKWGRARGRSWCTAMPVAPELRCAFLYGEGVHGYTKPDGRYMDDLWVY